MILHLFFVALTRAAELADPVQKTPAEVTAAPGGVWEVLSSSAYWINNPTCPPVTGRSPTEAQHFGTLAQEYAVELDCTRSDIAAMLPKVQEVSDDINEKIVNMSALSTELDLARESAATANHDIDRAPILHTSKQELRERAHHAESKMQAFIAQIAAIRSSIPFSDQPEMKDFIDDAMMRGHVQTGPDQLINATQLRSALEKLSARLEVDDLRMAFAGKHDGAGLTDVDRNQLAKDNYLRDRVIQRASPPDRQKISALSCHINARYGKGQDELDDAMMLGSLGLSALSGAGRLAFASRALAVAGESAFARGLVTLSQSRIIMAGAIALNSASVYRNVDHACQESNHVSADGRCENKDPIETLGNDNCYLALTLNALGYAFTPGLRLAKATSLWQRLAKGNAALKKELAVARPEINAAEEAAIEVKATDPAAVREEVAGKLGRPITASAPENTGKLTYDKLPVFRIDVKDQYQKVLSRFEYAINEKTKTLVVYNTDTYDVANRRKGLTEYALSEILSQRPDIQKTEAVLVDQNGAQVVTALKENPHLSCKDAIRLTAAYKMRARFGFTVISNEECNDIGAGFMTSKP